MSFAQFQSSPQGAAVAPVLKDRTALQRMEAFSRAGRPALLAVVAEIERVAPTLTDTEKQHVGRWVRQLLGPRGWRPVDKKRLPKGGLFTTAAVYARIGPADASADGAGNGRSEDDAGTETGTSGFASMASPEERLASARARIAALPLRPMSVERFIADKRREARRDA